MKRVLNGSVKLHLVLGVSLVGLLFAAVLRSGNAGNSAPADVDRVDRVENRVPADRRSNFEEVLDPVRTQTVEAHPGTPAMPAPPRTQDVDGVIQWLYSLSESHFHHLLRSGYLGRIADAVTWALEERNADKEVAQVEIESFVTSLNVRIRAVQAR